MTTLAPGSAAARPAPAGPGPVRVVLVDLDAPDLATLVPPPPVEPPPVEPPPVEPPVAGSDRGRVPGGAAVPYAGVRLFGLRNGRPVAELAVPAEPAPDPAALVERLCDLAVPADAPAVPDTGLPFASVVVPTTFARGPAVRRCVESLLALEYPSYEIIVVDNRRVPDEADWAALPADPRVRVVAEPVPGASAARNRGLAGAGGAVVAFTDDDVAVDRGWLRALAGRLVAEPDVDGVTGLVLPAELETPAQVWFEESGSNFARRYHSATYRVGTHRFRVTDRHADDPHRTASLYAMGPFGTGSNMAFRTAALRELGGFDRALGPGTPALAGEDIHVFLRLLHSGRALAFEPGAFVRHWHRRGYDELRTQIRGYGVGFTAMLTAAVLGDPRHLLGLLGVVRPGLLSLFGGASEKSDRRGAGYPAELGRLERRGMILGPFAYARSRSRMLRWRR